MRRTTLLEMSQMCTAMLTVEWRGVAGGNGVGTTAAWSEAVNARVAPSGALREGIALEIASIVWMVLEAAVAIGAGVVAGSVLLTGFGLDSVIELLSGGLLLWRLTAAGRSEDIERIERIEHRTVWLAALLLTLLALYLVVSSVIGLVIRFQPESSCWACW